MDLTISTMITASVLSVGFLIWFLVGLAIEGKRTTFTSTICCSDSEKLADSSIADAETRDLRHSVRLDLIRVGVRSLREHT